MDEEKDEKSKKKKEPFEQLNISLNQTSFHDTISPPSDSSSSTSPARRNKRKMMEPKRRSAIDDYRQVEDGDSSETEEDYYELQNGTPSPSSKSTVSQSSEKSTRLLTYPPSLDTYDDNDYILSKRARKNYKNMTRARRVEANARERSRVHTISAAFESLRRAVPSYSYNQKLSKLAILRIASSYIMSLGRLANIDYDEETGDEHFSECVDVCTSTIHAESKARKRQL